MYENLIGQERLVSGLSSEIQSGMLPSSVLFYGQPYSGKLSAALETARILTCERRSAAWNCPCRSCEQHRVLLHPHMLLLGSRYFAQEIAASADTLLRTRKDSAKYLFIRAVRKLLRRFDPFLWEGDDSRVQKIQPLIQSVEDRLAEFSPGRELPAEKATKKAVESILEECGKIASVIVSDNIPIHLIRRASYWARLSSPADRKIIILERADRMQENSRNALLKILEEPPAGVHFILLAERKSAVLPTILSRVRSYYFRDRNEETSGEILKKIFREESGEYRSLRDFFLAWKGIQPALLERVAERFLSAVQSGETAGAGTGGLDIFQEAGEAFGGFSDAEAFQAFLEELTRHMRKLLSGTGSRSVPLSTLEAWNGILRGASRENADLNISASVLLETMFYRMRETGR